jgi:urease accessory protein
MGAGAHVLLTTPAASKFYRSAGASAWQGQALQVGEGAILEWLPQETIVFDGAQVENLTRVELAADARFIGWEVLCLGRPASGDMFCHGQLRQRFEIWREGRPLLLERGRWQGGGAELQARWGLQGQPVLGTMVVTGRFDEWLPALQEGLAAHGRGFALTQLPELLVLRYLGDDAQQARGGFTAAWALLRPQLAGREAVIPRIWNT